MALSIFKKPHILRKFYPEGNGYRWEDQTVMLNVQPLTGKDLLALPEGERSIKRCKVIGENTCNIRVSDEEHGIWGDWLFYRGSWYKCEGADPRDATPIGQTSSQFVVVRENYPENVLVPPEENKK